MSACRQCRHVSNVRINKSRTKLRFMDESSISKSQAIAYLWQLGKLNYKFHAGQEVIEQKFNSVQGKLFVANISRRFGKTTWACIKTLETAIKKKNSKSIIATAFQTDAENIVLPIMTELLQDCPKQLLPTLNKTKKRFEFKNGSTISIVGLDKNPNSLRGNKLNGVIVLDEAGFISNLSYLYSSIIVPATMYSNTKVIMISTPPVSPDHSFKQFCEKASTESAYVTLTIYDNPLVTAELIEEYRKECLSETDFQREYECKFVTDQNLQIIPEFNVAEYVYAESPRNEFFKYYRKYVALDIGVNDPTSFLFAYYDWKKQVLIIEAESELQHQNVLTKNIASTISDNVEKLKYKPVFRTVSDNNNKILIQDLNHDYNLGVRATSKDSLHAMIAELRHFVKEGKLQVSSNCQKLINQLQFGVWNKHKTEFARQSGHHNDFLAALVYLVRNLSEHDSPIPATYGHTQNTWSPTKVDNENQFKKLFNL